MSEAIYTRLSQDRGGGGLGVQRQEEDCRTLAGPSPIVYSDNDISAFSGRKRPGYEALLTAIEAGSVSRIIAWHPDRLHRSLVELEHLVALAERHGIDIQTVQAGTLDLSTPTGRLVARLVGSVARFESEHKAERIRRQVEQNVAQGKRTGRRPYGWLLNGAPHSVEAPIVREVVGRLGGGEAVATVAKDLNRRGIPAPSSPKWSTASVRAIARRPRNIGMRVHHGQVVGRSVEQALVSEAEYRNALAFLDGPDRRTQRGTTPKHLLSGIATCGQCGAPLYARVNRGRHIYQCQRYHILRPQSEMDEFMTALILGRIADIKVPVTPKGDDGSLAELQRRQTEIADLIASGVLPAAAAKGSLVVLAEKIGALQAAQQSSVAAAAVMAPLAGDDPEGTWQAMAPSSRREVVRVLFESIVLHKANRHTPLSEVLQIRWRS